MRRFVPFSIRLRASGAGSFGARFYLLGVGTACPRFFSSWAAAFCEELLQSGLVGSSLRSVVHGVAPACAWPPPSRIPAVAAWSSMNGKLIVCA